MSSKSKNSIVAGYIVISGALDVLYFMLYGASGYHPGLFVKIITPIVGVFGFISVIFTAQMIARREEKLSVGIFIILAISVLSIPYAVYFLGAAGWFGLS